MFSASFLNQTVKETSMSSTEIISFDGFYENLVKAMTK